MIKESGFTRIPVYDGDFDNMIGILHTKDLFQVYADRRVGLIAALSFFIGQAKVFPEPIRIRPLLALPVLVVLVTMFYWLWRVRIRRSLRGLVGVFAPEAR